MTNDQIARAFDGHKAFIAFITCADPDLETTEEAVVAMAQEGVDLIELGIPFSDPTAEGPVIQEANARALRSPVTTDDVFAMVERVRGRTDVPLAFMTYANVLYTYGIERFARRMAECSMGAVILPDVPVEERAEFSEPLAACGIDLVSLVAPTSHERVRTVAEGANGFVYVVSSLGVTGVRSEITTDIDAMVALIREANPSVPCAVGFGISTPEQAADMASKSDGAIVGSAIVRIMARYGRDAVPHVREYVRAMVAATHAA